MRIYSILSISLEDTYCATNQQIHENHPASNLLATCWHVSFFRIFYCFALFSLLHESTLHYFDFFFLPVVCEEHRNYSSLFLFRDQGAVLIVKEQAFVQSGWENLLLPSTKATTQMVEHHGLEAVKNVVILLYSTSFYMCLTDANNLQLAD